MVLEVEIYDYFSGTNQIKAWLDLIGVRPKAKINGILHNLSETPAAQWHDQSGVSKRKGENDLWEIKAYRDKVQWRPLGAFATGDGTFTLLAGAKEQGGKLDPPTAPQTAQTHKADVAKDKEKFRRLHDYS